MTLLRALGSSGLQIPPLILGGNVFGWTVKDDTGFGILDAFVAGGGTMIDTADVYSAWVPGNAGGESERYIGQWLKRRGRRDDVLIATKVGMLDGEGGSGLQPQRIAAAVDASLARLGTDHIDLYFAHRDDPSVPVAEVIGAFARLVEAGKVRALGASNFDADRLGEALDLASAAGLPAYAVLQPEYNLISRDRFPPALQALCLDRDIGVVPYYGLASGFLTGKYRSTADLGKSSRGARMEGYLGARGKAVLAAMDAVAAETGASLAQIALAWLGHQPAITAPIASATSVGQLEELLGAMRLELSDDQVGRLTAASG